MRIATGMILPTSTSGSTRTSSSWQIERPFELAIAKTVAGGHPCLIMNSWNEPITCRPIGVIRTPHTDSAKTPRQPQRARGIEGRIEVDPRFEKGLAGIECYSHIVLLFVFDRAHPFRLTVTPPHDGISRGVFATRSPSRPNPIGMSVVRLLRREGRILHVADVDILDGTPILDIKPHIVDPRFESPVSADTSLAPDNRQTQNDRQASPAA